MLAVVGFIGSRSLGLRWCYFAVSWWIFGIIGSCCKVAGCICVDVSGYDSETYY
ncbi:hypothetical protein M1N64_03955 [Peptococcaceae bacterium]|nr:hypothetical protein [Peptococcaceae bacterium]